MLRDLGFRGLGMEGLGFRVMLYFPQFPATLDEGGP